MVAAHASRFAMRVAVISDIHANLHAFEAVLEAAAADAVDAVWCLGDVVGYGPRPNECCETVAVRATISLCGNHDLGVLGAIDLDDFNLDAALSARWTRDALTEPSRSFLASLETSKILDGPPAEL